MHEFRILTSQISFVIMCKLENETKPFNLGFDENLVDFTDHTANELLPARAFDLPNPASESSKFECHVCHKTYVINSFFRGKISSFHSHHSIDSTQNARWAFIAVIKIGINVKFVHSNFVRYPIWFIIRSKDVKSRLTLRGRMWTGNPRRSIGIQDITMKSITIISMKNLPTICRNNSIALTTTRTVRRHSSWILSKGHEPSDRPDRPSVKFVVNVFRTNPIWDSISAKPTPLKPFMAANCVANNLHTNVN